MINIEDYEDIEPIDTTETFARTPSVLYQKIVELQLKVNELIEIVNVLTLPDDPDVEDDEDEDDEDAEIVIGKPVRKR